MSFFDRSRKTDHPDTLHHAVQHLKTVLEQRQQALSSHLPAKTSTAVWCAIGLAALAGGAIYAARNPRIPEGVHPVEGFDLDRYLGKWHELARIEHSFEKGLQRTQAEYSRRPDGSVQVINRGFDARRGEWKVAHGKAKPTIAPDVAALKVTFFGPLYGGYNVVALGESYQWAMVIGSSLEHCWILSRTKQLPPALRDQLVARAQALGIDTRALIWVTHERTDPQP